MAWTYRIVDHGQHYALHSVEVDEGGRPKSWVQKAIDFAVDLERGPAGVVAELEQALKEARGHPVLRANKDRLELAS